jgi:hypothetical protein
MPASKTKNRPRSGGQGGRAGSGDGAKSRRTGVRKPPPRRGGYSAFALPLAVLGVFLLVAIALVVLYRTSSSAGGPSGEPVANVQCEANEQLATHYHAHLDLLYKGQPAKVPANIGVKPTCLYWLHTHDDTGVIHVEAPKDQAKRQFTLGDFFKVWGQPLDSKQVSTFKLQSGEQVKVWVDGKPYTGDPANIKLASKEQIVIEIGPPFVDPPPTFTWDPNTYAQ